MARTTLAEKRAAEEAARRTEDAAFIQTPINWPQWPLCPLKTIDTTNREVGFLVEESRKDGYTVYKGCFWGLTGKTLNLSLMDKLTYYTLDALLDIWEVD